MIVHMNVGIDLYMVWVDIQMAKLVCKQGFCGTGSLN